MSDTDKHQDDQKDDLLDSLLDLDRIKKEGATLKIVSDNMRALLACVGMLAAVVVLYNHESNHWFLKGTALCWGFWTSIYAILACLQASWIMGLTLFDIVVKVIHPDLLKRYKDEFVLIFAAVNMVIVFGTLILVLENVLRVFGTK